MKTNRTLLALGLAWAGLCVLAHGAAPLLEGYANVTLTNGYNFVANPLDADGTRTNDYITNVIPTAPFGTKIYTWDVTNQVFQQAAVFSDIINNWAEPDEITPCRVQLPPGIGFVLWSPSNWTHSFVGILLEGDLTNVVVGSNKLCLLGSMLPLAGPVNDGLGFPSISGADVQTFSSASQSYSNACTYFTGYGWYDPSGIATSNGPIINMCQAFFARNPGPDTNWVQVFGWLSLPQLAAGTPAGGTAGISSLVVSGTKITLNISNPDGALFDVQFSPDGRSWQTVAARQTGTVWTGPMPGSNQGYFQLARP